MDYWNNIISLKDKTLIKLTEKICKDRSFKEAVLGFARVNPPNEAYYMSPEERQEIYYSYQSTVERYAAFIRARYFRYEMNLIQWEAVMERHVHAVLEDTMELPKFCREEAKEWMFRHILEYLSYCRRLELLTGLPRYFFVDFVTIEDWNTEGRLNEKSLAERLIADERLTVLQRYKVACTYCLASQRFGLWWRLTQSERNSLNQNDDPLLTFEYNRSVLLWSYHMKGEGHYKVNSEMNPWMGAAEIAVYDGNIFALTESWKKVQFYRKGTEASNLAFRCFNQWKICKSSNWKRKLLSLDISLWSISDFVLPTHYARVISFLLRNMDEDELELFFEELLAKRKNWNALIYFLDWPNLDYFLSTIDFLGSFLPDEVLKMVYLESFLHLASMHLTQQEMAKYPNGIRLNGVYDYRRILRLLWDGTPNEYKRYVFIAMPESKNSYNYSFLMKLLASNPFLKEDEWLFIRVFRDATVTEKKLFLMSSEWKQVYGLLVARENWSLLDWLTKNTFDEDENEIFRRWYINSSFGRGLCFDLLLEYKEVIVNNLIRWSFKSEIERNGFKRNFLYDIPLIDFCLSVISEGNFLEVERIMNFCLNSSEIQDFKQKLAIEDSFYSLVISHEWEILDAYVAWCFESDEKIIRFKKNYFSGDGIDLYFHFVFIDSRKDIRKFNEWFNLSHEEIEKLKRDLLFSYQCIDYLIEILHTFEPFPIIPLLFILKDEKMILDLKCTLENQLQDDSNEKESAQYRLYCLAELLVSLKRMNPKDDYIPDRLIEFL